MEDNALRIITTDDGSSSIYHPQLKETYHSFHGAIQESRHVFIHHGLAYWMDSNKDKPVSILEVGFGTGLNALLTLEKSAGIGLPVRYTSLEAFPLAMEVIAQLNYVQIINDPFLTESFGNMHSAAWGANTNIHDGFTLKKVNITLEDFTPKEQYDIIYFDAFAPSKQPELWQPHLLEKLIQTLPIGGIFVTYCAKGQLKRDLKSLGMEVHTLPGPPGKKEMVRGIKL